jgi:hypothetical protein
MEMRGERGGPWDGDPAPDPPVLVEICRTQCGEVLWRFPFRDWLGFTPDEAEMAPVAWWVQATGIVVPRRMTLPGRRRQSPLLPPRALKGPSGRRDHPIVDEATGSLTIGGPSACRHVEWESVRWGAIAGPLRLAMRDVDGSSPRLCRVWVE